MAFQQSSIAPQTEQNAGPAGSPFTKEQWASFTEEQWEAAAAATLRAEIDHDLPALFPTQHYTETHITTRTATATMVRYISARNECSYVVKSAETKDVAAASKKVAAESKPLLSVKRSAEEEEEEEEESYKESKKFRLQAESPHDKSYTDAPATESSAEITEEEHVSLDDIMHEANLIGATMAEESGLLIRPSHDLPHSAPVELPIRLGLCASPLPLATPSATGHSEEWDEQEEHVNEEQFAFNFAMGVTIFDARATDIAKLLGAYDPLNDEHDDEERFREPLEAFHSSFYKLAGLRANGEEVSDAELDNEESVDSSEDEYDSDEDESDQSEFGDGEIDETSLIGDGEDDDERDDDQTELEGEGEGSHKGRVSHN
ncbi:hypothetical protein MBLNU13_g04881t1 [Cladosporium sp. NU13]